jgi:hypothetical protein
VFTYLSISIAEYDLILRVFPVLGKQQIDPHTKAQIKVCWFEKNRHLGYEKSVSNAQCSVSGICAAGNAE